MPEETEVNNAVETEEIPADVQVQAEVQAAAEPETTPDPAKPEWDQKRAAADAERAHNKKHEDDAAERGKLAAKLEQAQTDLETARQAKLSAEPGDEPDLSNYDTLVGAVKNLQAQTNEANTKLEEANSRAQRAEESAQKAQQQQELNQRVADGTKILNEELAKLDKKYGAQYRNAAYDKVSAEYKRLKVDDLAPEIKRDWIEKTFAAEYLNARAADVNKPAPAAASTFGETDVTLDTGSGGADPSNTITEGSFLEVSKQIDARNARLGH